MTVARVAGRGRRPVHGHVPADHRERRAEDRDARGRGREARRAVAVLHERRHHRRHRHERRDVRRRRLELLGAGARGAGRHAGQHGHRRRDRLHVAGRPGGDARQHRGGRTDDPAGRTARTRRRIGLLGSSTNAGSAGAGGTATITYTDGSTDTVHARSSATGRSAPAGSRRCRATSSRSRCRTATSPATSATTWARTCSRWKRRCSVAKTVSSITLPQATGGDMHVFAISLPPAPAHAVTLAPTAQKGGGRVGSRRHLHRAPDERRLRGRLVRGLVVEHLDGSRLRRELHHAGRHDGDGSARRDASTCASRSSVPASAANGDTERHHDHGDLDDRRVGERRRRS